MALGSSISKEETAAGVRLSHVSLDLISLPSREFIYPTQDRCGVGENKRGSKPAEKYGAQMRGSPAGQQPCCWGSTVGPPVASEPELGAQGMGVEHSRAQPPCPKTSPNGHFGRSL